MMALLKGHPVRSFIYHPLVIYTVLACAFLLFKKIRSPEDSLERPTIRILIIALVIIIANFVVKNVCLYFGVDLLSS